MKASKIDQAIDQFRRCTKAQGERGQAFGYVLLAQAYEAKGSYADALRAYDQSIAIGARFVGPSYGSRSEKKIIFTAMLEAYRRKAQLSFQLGQDLKSNLDVGVLQTAFSECNFEHLPSGYGITIGLVKLQSGDYTEADRFFALAVPDGAERANLWSRLAAIQHDRTYQFAGAYESFKQICKLVEKEDNALNLAEAALSAGHYEEAHRLASSAAEAATEPNLLLNAKLLVCLSSFLSEDTATGELECRGLIDFRESLPLDFKNDWSYGGTVHYLSEVGIPDELRSSLLRMVDYVQGKVQAGDLT